ncbi:MAG: hypothetical protein IJP96_05065 [Synergistaceae bacterium]|nr:hypothetical protein [Synergistaceae bacterium]
MGLDIMFPFASGGGGSGDSSGGTGTGGGSGSGSGSGGGSTPTPTPGGEGGGGSSSEPEIMDNTKWIYKNETKHKIIYRDYTWDAGATVAISTPIPSSLGLTCINEGNKPDPILFCNDIVIAPNDEAVVTLSGSSLTHNVHLTIQCITTRGTVECRFIDDENTPIFIDAQGFSQVMPFDLCQKIILKNTISNSLNVNVTAIEVV